MGRVQGEAFLRFELQIKGELAYPSYLSAKVGHTLANLPVHCRAYQKSVTSPMYDIYSTNVTQNNYTFCPEDILFEPVTCPPRYWSCHKINDTATSLARTCCITRCLWSLTFPQPKGSLTPLLRQFTMFILIYTCLQQNWVSVCFSRRCIQKRKNQEVEADAAVSAHQPLWRAATDHRWVGSAHPPGGTECLRLAVFSHIS